MGNAALLMARSRRGDADALSRSVTEVLWLRRLVARGLKFSASPSPLSGGRVDTLIYMSYSDGEV